MLSCFLLSGAIFFGTETELVAMNHVTSISIERGYVLDKMTVTTSIGATKTFNVKEEEGSAADIIARCVKKAKHVGNQ